MRISNTGKGGLFFETLYDDRIWAKEDRRHPATKEELLSAGLTEDAINQYLELIHSLYSALFMRVYQYEIKAHFMSDKMNASIEQIWKAIIDFCIDHELKLEYGDENRTRYYDRMPFEVEHFIFVEHYPECPNLVHVATLDEFRYEVEFGLSDVQHDDEWYLDQRYDVFLNHYYASNNTIGADYLERYDIPARKRFMLTRYEVMNLLKKIHADMADCDSKIQALRKSLPRVAFDGTHISEYNDIIKEQEEWRKQYAALLEESSHLEDCEATVNRIINAGTHDDIYPHFPDETLYVHKGNIVCETQHHGIEQATAVLLNSDGNDIELNVSHCKDCQKFFIRYESYKLYRERFGTILGNIRMIKNGEYTYDPFDLADESTLHLCGYNVSKKDNLSDTARQTIIAAAIESGAMSKGDVIHLLNYFIEVNGAKIGNELARHKWCVDLDFALAYKSSQQNRYRIGNVERYCRNRFCIHPAAPVKAKVEEPIDERKYLGLRVKHTSPQFNVGVVTDENDKNVIITFDNGKVVTFTRAVFSKGMVRVLE